MAGLNGRLGRLEREQPTRPATVTARPLGGGLVAIEVQMQGWRGPLGPPIVVSILPQDLWEAL